MFINLTPHDIVIVRDGIEDFIIPASGTVARLSTETVTVGDIDGIPVTATKYGEITGLPPVTPGNVYIVSALVAGRCPARTDVFIPNESVRDERGRIIGCKSLGRI